MASSSADAKLIVALSPEPSREQPTQVFQSAPVARTPVVINDLPLAITACASDRNHATNLTSCMRHRTLPQLPPAHRCRA